MNIFLTGATGGLGSRLVELLQRNGHVVSALTRYSEHAHNITARVVQGDLLFPSAYADELKTTDAIIHMAAVTHTTDPELYESVNAEGTRILLETAVSSGFTGRFLFVSTRAVGEKCGSYGASKEHAEEYVRKSQLPWTIVRPSEVYGASGAEAISSLISMARKSRVIPVPGWGHDRLAPVHLDDVLAGIVQSLWCTQAVKKIYTLAGPEDMTYNELARRILRLYNRNALLLPVPYQMLRFAAWACVWFGWSKPPIVSDQIKRLRCSKCSDIKAAVRDLAYSPRKIEVGVQSPQGNRASRVTAK